MAENAINCKEIILSNAYIDLIVAYEGDLGGAISAYNPLCYQIINDRYAVFHLERTDGIELELVEFPMQPRLLGPYGINSLDESGILPLHTHPYLPLTGQDIIIGIVDSGIDYTHPVFLYEDNTTKILSIWDQTIQEGQPPSNFQYGTEYTREVINEALNQEDPFEIVPSIDETGHGTFNAGVAAGRFIAEEQFIGAAPDAEIIMVKLKPGKEYLRDIYLVDEEAIVYQDNDIMLGINYLMEQAVFYDKPLVILVGLGNNQGSHDGTSVLEEYLNGIALTTGYSVVIAAGNESDLGHHYLGLFPEGEIYQDVEINIAPNERGINGQIWVQSPDVYSIGIISPTGEAVSRVSPRIRVTEEFEFILERSELYIEYQLIEEKSGDQLILIRIKDPTAGIWTVRVYGDIVVSGRYNF
ncbi:S8 family peptidase [Natranaerovirga hydrolytica]|nr:S8 family peptidase [Natranaerovirga hydrolytica]